MQKTFKKYVHQQNKLKVQIVKGKKNVARVQIAPKPGD